MTMALNPDAAWVSDDSSPQQLGSRSQHSKPRLSAVEGCSSLFELRSRVWRSFLHGDDDTSTLAHLEATRLCGPEVTLAGWVAVIPLLRT